MLSRRALSLLLLALGALAALAGCGGSSAQDRPAPSAADFPAAKGKTLPELLQASGAKPAKLVVAPAATVFEAGPNRYPFGVFTKGQEQVPDAEVALYVARDEKSPARGPFPARATSLETKPAYRASASDPNAAKYVYVVPRLPLDAKGAWTIVAMFKGEDGLEASRVGAMVGDTSAIPGPGDPAPRIHTPTAADVGGDLAKIDTRKPPDQMHQVDFAEVLGKQPVVLVFATPAFCQSRVCGPVVDVAQQVADEFKGKAVFIHQEVYVENKPPKINPQLRAFGLETEPWIFLIDREGIVRDRIEGAVGVSELEDAMRTIVSD